MRACFDWMLRQFFPPACPLCLETFDRGWAEPFCCGCLAGFNPLPASHCPVCSVPFLTPGESSHLCGRCSIRPPPFAKVHLVGLYQQSLRQAIHQFKFNGRVGLDRPLGRLLHQAVGISGGAELVVPVPLHRQRLQQRSYNQALLLAREVARFRRLPVCDNLLVKTRETCAQQELSAKQRESNLAGVFQLHGRLAGEKVLLIDDVMTTGATVGACSSSLLEAGASRVEVAVIGRALVGQS